MSRHALAQGRGTSRESQHSPALAPETGNYRSLATGSALPVQSRQFVAPHFPFQPLPTPRGTPPFRFDLTDLLHPDAVQHIIQSGKLVFHTVGDTGDERGKEMDFVAALMTNDYTASPADSVPAFYYHLGDVVYFAGDIDMYGENFYETYSDYPAPIVSIPGNHDCQPDDPQDGPVDPNKKPLDGWVQNFMSDDPTRLGSLKTNSARTQMNLPNVYWTFTTPFATIIGLFSNVSETEAALHQDQINWFKGELSAAEPHKALFVTIHHPPFSGDDEHSGSTVAEKILFESFAETGVYPHFIMSGHVHNFQRFTVSQQIGGSNGQITCLVLGNGGYTRLGQLHKLGGEYPQAPLQLTDNLSLDAYDQQNFGFARIEVSASEIVTTVFTAPYNESATPTPGTADRFVMDIATRRITAA